MEKMEVEVKIWLPGSDDPIIVNISPVESWDLDDPVELVAAMTESTIIWASDNGYSYDDLYWEIAA